jgi:hypothetical protein
MIEASDEALVALALAGQTSAFGILAAGVCLYHHRQLVIAAAAPRTALSHRQLARYRRGSHFAAQKAPSVTFTMSGWPIRCI